MEEALAQIEDGIRFWETRRTGVSSIEDALEGDELTSKCSFAAKRDDFEDPDVIVDGMDCTDLDWGAFSNGAFGFPVDFSFSVK